MVRVLVVDDSRVFRGIVEVALSKIPGVTVAGSVWNGVKALEFLEKEDVDIITLDVEMPEMDGFQTLKMIEERYKAGKNSQKPAVIMLSSSTSKGAKVTVEALELGAFDFILKPNGEVTNPEVLLQRELHSKIFAWKKGKDSAGSTQSKMVVTESNKRLMHSATKKSALPADAIVIGVSTGGPKALTTMLPELSQMVNLPIFIVQHMPAGFTSTFAEGLNRRCRHTVLEATDGMEVNKAHVYIAPGGKHMTIRREGVKVVIRLNDNAPEEGCRPSVNVLFRSAGLVYGGHLVAVVMTGMGVDGAGALRPLKRKGVRIVIQDEKSSVVWGMPGAAKATGLVDSEATLSDLPKVILEQLWEGGEDE